jgi:hypothetical protein
MFIDRGAMILLVDSTIFRKSITQSMSLHPVGSEVEFADACYATVVLFLLTGAGCMLFSSDERNGARLILISL